jgi:23S rRNA (guanosine2251-2'-O)-methyltransferase
VIKKGFAGKCQVCDDFFMSKPPKRNLSSRKTARNKPETRTGRPNSGEFRKAPREAARPVRDARPEKNRESGKRESRASGLKADLFGMHAVREAWLNPKRYVHALFITEDVLKDFEPQLKATQAKRPEPQIVTKEELDRAFPTGTVHQGIALSCQPLAETSVMDLIIKSENNPKSVILVLDQVTDPHNVGAILRSACAFGADGVVMQSKHAPELTGILAKTACGAADHIPVAYETNLSRALEKLQEHHYTVIGLDEHSEKTFGTLPKYERAVLVLGAEGPGMRRLVKEHCDVLVTLPTKKPINSLNVSNAAAVALYALLA